MSGEYAILPDMIRHALPPRAGYNSKTRRQRYVATQAELDHLAVNADTAVTSLLCSLRVLGRTLMHAEVRNLDARDLADLADSVVTLSESVLALRDIELCAREGEAAPVSSQEAAS